MATWSQTAIFVYSPTGQLLLGSGSTGDVYTDGETEGFGSDTFEIHDIVAGFTYTGAIEFPLSRGAGTQTLPVLQDPESGNYRVLGNRVQSDYVPPQSVSIGDLANGSTFLVCFLEGTGILTPEGQVGVETLTVGQDVLTADGKSIPVKWVGHRTVDRRFMAWDLYRLIRVEAGAFGPGVPARDLVVTADHGLVVDGLIMTAGALVNGTSISVVAADTLAPAVTVFHVETEAHEVILAEGMQSETYIDFASRKNFANYAEYVALYGADRPIREAPRPRISSQNMLPVALKERLSIGQSCLDVA